jgi:hypothetical protein
MQDDTRQQLEDTLQALAERTQAPVPPVPETGTRTPKPTMRLPDGLAQEAARMVFEFWELNSGRRMPWEQLPARYQVMWVEIIRVVLEMTVTVQLTDIHRFFEQSNGDMGAAFARALRRYASEVMNTKINP